MLSTSGDHEAELTAIEACRILGVGLDFIYRLIYSGKLPARKVEKVWRIPSAAVEERLRRREAGIAA
jgi:excisionase family DNA binding protein